MTTLPPVAPARREWDVDASAVRDFALVDIPGLTSEDEAARILLGFIEEYGPRSAAIWEQEKENDR